MLETVITLVSDYYGERTNLHRRSLCWVLIISCRDPRASDDANSRTALAQAVVSVRVKERGEEVCQEGLKVCREEEGEENITPRLTWRKQAPRLLQCLRLDAWRT
jgi:hypothetical protein